jgi:lysophospholipase L1-like esterase
MASPLGRGAQVRLDGDAQARARGAGGRLLDNIVLKEDLERDGLAADGNTPDGSTVTGQAARDEALITGGVALPDALDDALEAAETAEAAAVGLQDAVAAAGAQAGAAAGSAQAAADKLAEVNAAVGPVAAAAGAINGLDARLTAVPAKRVSSVGGLLVAWRDGRKRIFGGIADQGRRFFLGPLTVAQGADGIWTLSGPRGVVLSWTSGGKVVYRDLPVGTTSVAGAHVIQRWLGKRAVAARWDKRDGALRMLGYNPATDPAATTALVQSAITTRLVGPIDSRRVCYVGDSNTALFDYRIAGLNAFRTITYVPWLAFLSGRRIDMQYGDNFATSGLRSDEITPKALQAAALGYGVAIIMEGTNDITQGRTADQIVTTIISHCEAFLTKGTRVVLMPIYPRGGQWKTDYGGSLTEAQIRARQDEANRRLRDYAFGRLGVRWVDPRPALTDPATGLFASGMNFDRLHLQPKGAFEVARLVWAAMQDWLPAGGPSLPSANWEAWDATYNANGNLLTNGMLTGTTGSVGAPAAGTAPDGWAATVTGSVTGGTVVLGREARSDGSPGEWLTITVTGLTGPANPVIVTLSQAIAQTGGNYAAGDVVEMVGEMEVVAGSANVSRCSITLTETDGTTPVEYTDLEFHDTWPIPTRAQAGVLSTPRCTVRTAAGTPSLTASIVIRLRAAQPGGAAITARFARLSVHKV